MKSLRAKFSAAVVAAMATCPAFSMGFSDSVLPSGFNVVNTGNITGMSPVLGTATFEASQLLMVGSDSTSINPSAFTPGCSGGVYGSISSPCQLQATTSTPGTYTFDWSYATSDDSGPAGDIFGVIVDNKDIALSDPGGAIDQMGTATFTAVSSFGWFINCTDCIDGSANATISDLSFAPAVPEPSSALSLLVGLAAMGTILRLRWAGDARRLNLRDVRLG